MLTDANMKFTQPAEATSTNRPPSAKAGDVIWAEAETHLPENAGDKPFEAILIELKTRAAKKTQQ